jgi:hypothetical protein
MTALPPNEGLDLEFGRGIFSHKNLVVCEKKRKVPKRYVVHYRHNHTDSLSLYPVERRGG